MTKPIIGPIDALRINGQIFAFIACGSTGGRLVPLSGNSDEIHITTEELTDLVRSETAWVIHRYFSEAQAKRRSIAGHKVLTTLPASERALVMWKVRCCEVFLKAERAEELSRTDLTVRAFYPEFQRRIDEGGLQDGEKTVYGLVIYWVTAKPQAFAAY